MIPGDIPQFVVLIWLFVFGTVVGSFLNVCIYRLPLHEDLWSQLKGLTHPPSTCPFCRTRIRARDNIPILGWLLLAGRCRTCRHRIPPRYALIEFFNGMLWVLLYVAIVPAGYSATVQQSCLWSSLGPLDALRFDHARAVFLLNAQFLYYLVMAEALLVATFIDFDRQIIPDGSTLPAMAVGVLGAFAIGDLHVWPVWFQSSATLQTLQHVLPEAMHWMLLGPDRPAWLASHPHWHGLVSSLAGIVAGGGAIQAVRLVGFWAWGREVMGFGDVILMAMIGSFLGWQPTLLVFFVAPFCSLVAVVISRQFFRNAEIAYGPYLSLGAILVLLFWRPYFSHFEGWFSLGLLIVVQAAIMLVLLVASLILVRAVKRALGMQDFAEEELDWRSSDQLAFYANKDFEAGRGNQLPRAWPGVAAGQGRQFVDRWRQGTR